MKLFSEETQAALERGDVIVSAAVEILCDQPFRVWGGYGPLTIDSQSYAGIGDRGLAQEVGQAVGGASQAVQLQLSGIEQAVADLVDVPGVRAAPVTIHKLIFDGSGTKLLDASIYSRGRVDQLPVADTPGGTSTITAMVETAARGLRRKGGRMRTDADQRLIKANDGSMKSISYAGEKTLYWGGKRPTTVSTGISSRGAGFMNQNVQLA